MCKSVSYWWFFLTLSIKNPKFNRIYKDLVNNDIITNIKKYTKKLWNVVWGKIEKYIPFTDEFKQLYNEFRNAWETFLKTAPVVYVRDKVSLYPSTASYKHIRYLPTFFWFKSDLFSLKVVIKFHSMLLVDYRNRFLLEKVVFKCI